MYIRQDPEKLIIRRSKYPVEELPAGSTVPLVDKEKETHGLYTPFGPTYYLGTYHATCLSTRRYVGDL